MEEPKNIEVVSLENMSRSVIDLAKFEITKAELQSKVDSVKTITVTDLKDETALGIVRSVRKELRSIEIRIEKQGKSYRDIFTTASRQVMEKERELLSITGPEIARLESFEEQAEEFRLQEERAIKLPIRKEKLATIGDSVEIDDYLLTDKTDLEFEAYYNERVFQKNQLDRFKMEQAAEAERKRIAEETAKIKAEAEAKAAEERRKIEEERAAMEAAAAATRKAEQEKLDAAQKKIDDERQKLEDEKREAVRKKEVEEAEARAKIQAEEAAKQKVAQEAEAKRAAEAEAQAEKARQEALRPDKEKLRVFAGHLAGMFAPELTTKEAKKQLADAQDFIHKAIAALTK